jgi:hypothetical protein
MLASVNFTFQSFKVTPTARFCGCWHWHISLLRPHWKAVMTSTIVANRFCNLTEYVSHHHLLILPDFQLWFFHLICSWFRIVIIQKRRMKRVSYSLWPNLKFLQFLSLPVTAPAKATLYTRKLASTLAVLTVLIPWHQCVSQILMHFWLFDLWVNFSSHYMMTFRTKGYWPWNNNSIRCQYRVNDLLTFCDLITSWSWCVYVWQMANGKR